MNHPRNRRAWRNGDADLIIDTVRQHTDANGATYLRTRATAQVDGVRAARTRRSPRESSRENRPFATRSLAGCSVELAQRLFDVALARPDLLLDQTPHQILLLALPDL